MSEERARLLEERRRTEEVAWQQWALENSILGLGEQLFFEVRIVKTIPVVIGRVLDKVPLPLSLPPDRVNRSRGWKTFETYKLTIEDWDKIGNLPWDDNQLKLLGLLQSRENVPLSRKEMADHGIFWSSNNSSTLRFNSVLKPYKQDQSSDTYYKIEFLSGEYAGCLTIIKIKRLPREE